MEDGSLRQPSAWDAGLVKIDAFGMAAISIKRSVFDQLHAAGYKDPLFRFWYHDDSQAYPGEDIYFARLCEVEKIDCFCDCSLVTPHLITSTVDQESWDKWLEDHPELKVPDPTATSGPVEELLPVVVGFNPVDELPPVAMAHWVTSAGPVEVRMLGSDGAEVGA
jgi:hypothetical protein